jgi:inhibitor of cysteine peptidase
LCNLYCLRAGTKSRPDSSPSIATQTNLVGAAGKELWTFKALQDGTSTIRLEYIRPWEAGAPPAETFTLTVVVD